MQPISQKICKYNVFRPKICKYVVFSPEIRKYGIFVAKICKNALINSFEGFAVVIDNSASYAGLAESKLLLKIFIKLSYLQFYMRRESRIDDTCTQGINS